MSKTKEESKVLQVLKATSRQLSKLYHQFETQIQDSISPEHRDVADNQLTNFMWEISNIQKSSFIQIQNMILFPSDPVSKESKMNYKQESDHQEINQQASVSVDGDEEGDGDEDKVENEDENDDEDEYVEEDDEEHIPVKPQGKQECTFCGTGYKKLGSHIWRCKAKLDHDEAVAAAVAAQEVENKQRCQCPVSDCTSRFTGKYALSSLKSHLRNKHKMVFKKRKRKSRSIAKLHEEESSDEAGADNINGTGNDKEYANDDVAPNLPVEDTEVVQNKHVEQIDQAERNKEGGKREPPFKKRVVLDKRERSRVVPSYYSSRSTKSDAVVCSVCWYTCDTMDDLRLHEYQHHHYHTSYPVVPIRNHRL